MNLYPRYTELPEEYIKESIQRFLKEDAPSGDFTSAGTIDPESISRAVIEAQEDMIFVGEKIIKYFFEDDDFTVQVAYRDGQEVKKGEVIAEIEGPSAELLTRERVLLNLIQRLCGIATLTRKYTKITEKYGVKVLDTRKTTPGLRLFEKYAVACGGGWNHRLDLSSGILIKDNHIKAAGNVFHAVVKVKEKEYDLPVELEVEDFEEIKAGMEVEVDGFLLDNMSPDDIRRAIKLIGKYSAGREIFIEASGGITLENLEEYAKSGVHAISVGALTHSVTSAEIYMEFID